MKYYLIAGEASGDLHGANLMRGLKLVDKEAVFRFWGGDLMLTHGGKLVKHYKELAFMGFVEVVMNLRTIKQNIKFCQQDILSYKPDVLILIDYPGFNLRISEFAKKNGIKVYYYISPKIWAWKESRIKKIKKYVDRMHVIFPFETEFYQRFDYPVVYKGNPLIDAIEEYLQSRESFDRFVAKNQLDSRPKIAILAGSRKQEIERILPTMLEMIPLYPQYQFVLAGAPSIERSVYEPLISGKDIALVFGQTYETLLQSQGALVTSGTATLEAALLEVPQVVCYKAHPISYFIGKQLVKLKYISLVNLIVDAPVLTELLQKDLNNMRLKKEMDLILSDNKNREKMLGDYKMLRRMLGGIGASERFARSIYESLKS